jgi:hypothetical protein
MKAALNIGLQQAAKEFDLPYILTNAMSPDSLFVPANDLRVKLLNIWIVQVAEINMEPNIFSRASALANFGSSGKTR